MKTLRQWLGERFAREASVAVASCVHYTGCRYGRGEVHPYESYAIRHTRHDTAGARAGFIHFLRHYRPRHFGEAIDANLQGRYALWQFPWSGELPPGAWRDDPAECPDIVTHFSPRGIPWPRIEEEFQWLERAVETIRQHGYDPARFGSPITVRRLVRSDGSQVHLVLDGNHRLSALSALGRATVRVRLAGRRDLHEHQAPHWSQVAAGRFTAADARGVFHAYFEGNHRTETTREPAPLLGAPV